MVTVCPYFKRSMNAIDQTTACTIATSLIHSKIDYCNFLLLNLPATQTNCLQLVLNSAARVVTKTPKFHHIAPILKSLQWLKIFERIKHRVFFHTHLVANLGSRDHITLAMKELHWLPINQRITYK